MFCSESLIAILFAHQFVIFKNRPTRVWKCLDCMLVINTVLRWIYTDELELDGSVLSDVVEMLHFANMYLLDQLRDRYAQISVV